MRKIIYFDFSGPLTLMFEILLKPSKNREVTRYTFWIG